MAKACTCQHQEAPRVAAITEPLDASFPVPAYPPAEWFEEPDWIDPGEGLTVTDEGRVAGYFYQAGACLLHDHSACPAPSPTGYAPFHQQGVIVEGGERLAVGVIGNVNGHADPHGTVESAQRHYADPDSQMIVCRAGDNEHGGWIAGALVPRLTYGDVALVRACSMSGDWRPMPASWWKAHGVSRAAVAACEGYDCIGPTLVNRPGLPLVRQYARTAATLARWEPQEDTVNVTLPNGTVIEGEPEHVEAIMASIQAAEPPAEEPEPEADPMAEYDQRLGALEEAVGQIVEWITAQREQVAASVDAKLIPMPEANSVAV